MRSIFIFSHCCKNQRFCRHRFGECKIDLSQIYIFLCSCLFCVRHTLSICSSSGCIRNMRSAADNRFIAVSRCRKDKESIEQFCLWSSTMSTWKQNWSYVVLWELRGVHARVCVLTCHRLTSLLFPLLLQVPKPVDYSSQLWWVHKQLPFFGFVRRLKCKAFIPTLCDWEQNRYIMQMYKGYLWLLWICQPWYAVQNHWTFSHSVMLHKQTSAHFRKALHYVL